MSCLSEIRKWNWLRRGMGRNVQWKEERHEY